MRKVLFILPILVVVLLCSFYTVVAADTGTIGVPQNITVIPTNSTLTLIWDTVAGATGYDIEVDSSVIDNSNSTTYLHAGLNPKSSHTYRVRAKNAEFTGEWTTMVTVSLIDSMLTPKITIDNSESTNSDVLVTISDWGNVVLKKFRVNGGAWTNYSAPFTISSNCVVEAQGIDISGKKSGLARFKITNIDKEPPSYPFIKVTSRDLVQKYAVFSIIEGNDIGSGVSKTQYKVEGSDWVDYTQPVMVNYGSGKQVSTRSIDRAGNISPEYSILLRDAVAGDLQAPGVPFNLTFTGATQTSASLSWSAPTDNVGVKGYEIYRDGVKIGMSYSTDVTCVPLTPGKSYNLTVRAFDEAGNISDDSAPLAIKTLSDTQPPTTPSELTLLSSGQTSASFTWRASTDDIGVKGYQVFCNGQNIGFTTDWQYTSSGLVPGGSYTFTVCAVDLGGNVSPASDGLTVATQVDAESPSTPAELRMLSKTDTSVTIGWEASTDNIGVARYDVYRDGVKIGTTPGTWIINSPLTPGKSYIYTVKAVDSAGNYSDSSDSLAVTTNGDTQKPTKPLNLKATSATETSIDLAWDVSIDNVAVAGYELYRDGVKVGSTPGNTITNIPLSPGKSYTYTVKAYDAVGNYSDESDAVTASTLLDTTAPTVPTGLTSDNATETTISLRWNASTDNVAVKSYEIFRDNVELGTAIGTTYLSTGLVPNTAYHYWIKALDTSDNESASSDVLVVSTIPDTQAPSAPVNVVQVSKTETSITISWTAATDNVGVTGYDLYRDGVKVGTTPALTITNSPLTPGKSYTYTVKAYDAAGNYSNPSDPVTISTVGDTQAPTAPTNVTAVSKTETTVSLSWTAATDNVGVSGYYIYRDGTKIGSTTGLTYTSTSLSPNKTYTYTVKAYDGVVNISNASDPLAVATNPDTQAPSVPAGITVASTTLTSVTLAWSASTDNVAVTGYEVYRDSTKIGTTSGLTITNIPLTPGKTYNYTIRAYDAAGNYSALSSPLAATTVADTQPPTVPVNLSAASKTETTVTLTWSPSTDNMSVVGYYVYRDGTKIGTSTSLTFTSTGLTPGTTYAYTLKAYDGASNFSGLSAPLSVTTNNDTQAPTVPTGLSTSTATETTITLAWTAATDNVAVKGYDLYRDGTKVGTTPGLNYTVGPLSPGKTYTFTLKAYDAAGNYSDSSSPLTASTAVDTTPPQAPAGLTASNVTETGATLTWSPSTDNSGIKNYNVYGNDVLIGSLTATSYQAALLIPGTTYTFTVKAVDLAGNESQASTPLSVTTLSDTVKPSTPTGLSATGISGTSVTLSWTASTDDSWVTGYEVYRDGVKIGTTPGTTIDNTKDIVSGNTYSYTVKAYDVAGNLSDESAPVSVTIPSGM